MAKKPTLTNISSGFASNTQLNNNFQGLRNAFDNTLSLDGSTPNAMLADLDLNGNNINNVGDLGITGELTLDGQIVTSLVTVPQWKGQWVTGTVYALNDLVKYNGTVYIVKIAHTSGTFSVDQGAGKLEVFAEKGSSGAGTGDMLTTNNLSDLTNKPQAIINLGINATAAELNYVDGVTSNVQTQLDAKAPLGSPALIGTPTAPTASAGTNTTQVATTAFVTDAVATSLLSSTGMTLLGTLTTTSGSTQTLSGLTLTSYKQLVLEWNGVSHNSGTSQDFSIGAGKVMNATPATGLVSGMVTVSLVNGIASPILARLALPAILTSDATLAQTGYSTATTSVSVSVTAGAFDAGSIRIYGVK
jgi:hypothetical protein